MELKNFFTQDRDGRILPFSSCYLYLVDGVTNATGMTNVDGNPITNPFNSNADGLVQFAAPNGLYKLKVVSGIRVYELEVQCNDVTDTLKQAGELLDDSKTYAATASAAATLAKDSSDQVSAFFLPMTTDLGTVTDTLTIDTDPSKHVSLFSLELSVPSCKVDLSNFTPPTGYTWAFSLVIKQGTGANKIEWPTYIKWPGGIAPQLSFTKDYTDIVSFLVLNGEVLGSSGGGWYV